MDINDHKRISLVGKVAFEFITNSTLSYIVIWTGVYGSSDQIKHKSYESIMFEFVFFVGFILMALALLKYIIDIKSIIQSRIAWIAFSLTGLVTTSAYISVSFRAAISINKINVEALWK